ncbi:Cytochrome P450 71D445 [Linum perenne]
MMKNPRVMKKAQSEIREAVKGKSTISKDDIKDLPYLNSMIKETFRLHPSAPLLLLRESKEDCVVGGYEIPKKTKVTVNALAIRKGSDDVEEYREVCAGEIRRERDRFQGDSTEGV